MLLAHENTIMCFTSVLCPELGLVKDKLVPVISVDLNVKDQAKLDKLPAGYCHLVPEYLAKGIWAQVLNCTKCLLKHDLLEHWQRGAEVDVASATEAGPVLFVELAYLRVQDSTDGGPRT